MTDEMTLTEASAYADLGKSLLAQRLREQRIQGRKIGPMWLVDKASLDAYLAGPRKPGPKRKQEPSEAAANAI